MRTMNSTLKSSIFALTRRRMDREYEGDMEAACLYWAMTGVQEIQRAGHDAILQAGTLSWPRVNPWEDDGKLATHFSYVWEPDSPMTAARFAVGDLPEMHVWIALPERNEFVDFTTSFLPQMCMRMTGMEWTAPHPPLFLWAKVDQLPEGVVYAPDMKAIALALECVKVVKAERAQQ